jgi:hypothetical protein
VQSFKDGGHLEKDKNLGGQLFISNIKTKMKLLTNLGACIIK